MAWYADFSDDFAWLSQLPGLELCIPPYFVELPGLRRIFSRLSQSPRYGGFRWVITSAQFEHPDQFATPVDRGTVMIYLSNEDFRLPWYTPQLARLFTPYYWSGENPGPLRAIPLGCLGQVPEYPFLPLAEREIDVFFSGQILPVREAFEAELSRVLKFFQPQQATVMALWSGRFRSGLKPRDYGAYLAQSRVALIPRGNSSVTYRFFEAMRAGCILVCEPQKPAWYLDSCPSIVMPADWNHLLEVLNQLWERPRLMQRMHEQTRACYEQACCPEAVADYILKELPR